MKNEISTFVVFHNGQFLASFKEPDSEKFKLQLKILNYFNIEGTLRFVYKIKGKGLECISFKDYELLDNNQRTEIVNKIKEIENNVLNFVNGDIPFIKELFERVSQYETVCYNAYNGSFLQYLGMNYPIKYEDLKDSEFFKETIFRRLYYYFNWPLGDSYIEDFKQIESFYKSKGYNFELIEQRHPVIKYNEKYYYLNVLTDLETQFKQIVNDEILGYDDPKRYYYEAFVEHFERLGD